MGRGLLEALHAQDGIFHGQMSVICFTKLGWVDWKLGSDQFGIFREQEEHKNQPWEVQMDLKDYYWTFQNNHDFASCNQLYISGQENADG